MKVINGGRAELRRKAQKLLLEAIMTNNDALYNQLREMAHRDARRANLRLITVSGDRNET